MSSIFSSSTKKDARDAAQDAKDAAKGAYYDLTRTAGNAEREAEDALKGTYYDTRDAVTGTYYQSKNAVKGTYYEARDGAKETYYDTRDAVTGAYYNSKDAVKGSYYNAKQELEEVKREMKETFTMDVPAFSDIAKLSNDLLSKDFYHTAAATLEVKSRAPNGVNYLVKGKSAHDGPLTGSLEGKYADKESGITGTLTWSTVNVLEAKLELADSIAKGLKAEALTTFRPDSQARSAKLNLHFKQPAFHLRSFIDLLRGPTAHIDAVIGHEGFLVGGEAGYDVQKAAITKYSAAIGYLHPSHHVAITATNNLSIFTASYFHKVNSQVEAGAKAAWDSKSSGTVGLEVAGKYVIDPLSFAKAKIDDRGIAALAYNIKVKPGFTFGLGASFDTQKLNEAGHKVGASFVFEG